MKLAKSLLVVLVIPALVALVACNVEVPRLVTASGNAETRDFELSGFTKIRAAVAFVVDVKRADAFKVRVTADDNVWDELDISRSGNTLRLATKPNVSILRPTLKAEITLPELSGLDLSGAAKASMEGFTSGDRVDFVLSGASLLDMVNTESGQANFDVSGASKVSGATTMTNGRFRVSGAGRMDLAGSGVAVTVDASGASQVDLDQFKLDRMDITLSGASQARVDAKEITRANLSGASRLFYAGSPKMGNVDTSGGSSISRQ